MSEKNITQNVFPEFHLVPNPLELLQRHASRIGHLVLDHIRTQPKPYHSDHYKGADDMLLAEEEHMAEYWQPFLDHED
jgi:hypothetical protein